MTFEMEDIFAQLTLEAFKNETKFSVKEVKVKDASRTPRAILLGGSTCPPKQGPGFDSQSRLNFFRLHIEFSTFSS